jgi:hypothetical protein
MGDEREMMHWLSFGGKTIPFEDSIHRPSHSLLNLWTTAPLIHVNYATSKKINFLRRMGQEIA